MTEKFFISSETLNHLRNLNDIYRKDLTFDNVISHKNQSFTHSSEETILKKSQGVGKLTLPPPVILGLNKFFFCHWFKV